MRWYVQEDGAESVVKQFVDSLDGGVASYAASGSRGGAAEARNLALARSHGEVVMMLDADDRLTDGAVHRVIEALENGRMWCGFGALDERNGETTKRDGGYSMRLGSDRVPPQEASSFVADEWMGECERGAMRACWEQHGVLPFHPATFATYSRWIWDVGGWPGLARDEDTALILAITDRHAGVVCSEANIAYRRHQSQTSQLVSPNDARLEFIRRLAK
jgi:glycosyltransferase involved in cell wall biosynthesis